jgi:glycosyltransferase involved in cell wall biosynthesis
MKNEEELLPYFLRHYEMFADRIFIIDDESTDRTVEIARTHPKVTLLEYDFKGAFTEDDMNNCFTSNYKKYSRGVADWVIVADGDEFLHNWQLKETLEIHKELGTKVLKATGFMMFSETPPAKNGQIYDEICWGTRHRLYDKAVIFNPEIDITWGCGRHKAVLPPGVYSTRAKINLLHYHYVSRNSALRRLFVNIESRFSGHKKFGRKVAKALQRYDNGMRALKNGELMKVI